MDRIALVIGNSNYEHVSKLTNPKNDARDIGDILRKLGFIVKCCFDLSIDEINKVTREFSMELEDYSTGLFFYAGHGMQIDGLNYLVPIDCKMLNKEKTALSCFNIGNFLNNLAEYENKTNICILDACRDNPFAYNRNLISGFKDFDNQPKGSIISFSTSKDGVASDGEESNGLYTSALKESILIPNIKIEDVFKSTRKKVLDLSEGEQVSWEHSCLVGDFYFLKKETLITKEVKDEDIHDFIEERYSFYEKEIDDIYDIECLPYVDAYDKFHLPILKIVRAFSRIDNKKNDIFFNDSTIDEINITYLKTWGFYQQNNRWYYKNHYVKMGEPLPLPKELLPLKPLDGCEINVTGQLKCHINGEKIFFLLNTTLPENIPVIFTLEGKKYLAESSGTVFEGNVSSNGFSNKGKLLSDGLYKISVSCPIYSVLPDSVKNITGVRNRNLIGNNIKYNPIGGNTVSMDFDILMKDNIVSVVK